MNQQPGRSANIIGKANALQQRDSACTGGYDHFIGMQHAFIDANASDTAILLLKPFRMGIAQDLDTHRFSARKKGQGRCQGFHFSLLCHMKSKIRRLLDVGFNAQGLGAINPANAIAP